MPGGTGEEDFMEMTDQKKQVNMFLGDYRLLKKESLGITRCFPKSIIKRIDYRPLKKKPLAITGHFPKSMVRGTLNVFRQLKPKETEHSRILCDLLNPNEPLNEYGAEFLRLFFDMVLKDPRCMYDPGDRWEVTAEVEHYDVRIRNQDWSKIIILENKSNEAGDQPNQLYRYWYFGIHSVQKNLKNSYAKILYVSPGEYKKYDVQSITRPDDPAALGLTQFGNLRPTVDESLIKTVFFKPDITDWLEECLKVVEKKSPSSEMIFYIKQYHDFWRTSIMTDELIARINDFFRDIEQWNSFVELSKVKDVHGGIMYTWCSGLQGKLNKCFLGSPVEKWRHMYNVYNWGNENRWFLTEYGNDSVVLALNLWDGSFFLRAGSVNMPKMCDLLQTPKYAPIIDAFDNPHETHFSEPNRQDQIAERGNFHFGDTDNGPISPEKFAWYAHYRADEVVTQILEKVNRFRTQEITALLEELNQEVKNNP